MPSSRAATRRGGETLNRTEKAEAIAEVEQRLGATDTVLAADFRGLTVSQLSQLRGALREVDAEMTVVKNTLARRAASATGREALLPYLEGPTGLVWVDGDPALAAKALNAFAVQTQRLALKGGILEGGDIDAAGVGRLAALPSREVLIAQLAGGVAAPLRGLAGSLHNLIAGLARTLAAVQEQKSAEA